MPVQGAIVNVSSIAAEMPMMNFSAYCVAKAASDSLTKNLVRLMRNCPGLQRVLNKHAFWVLRTLSAATGV